MSNSHIQRTIISRLKNANSLRYSELQPDGLDKDLFNYHLRELLKNGMVDKLSAKEGYRLSEKGQQHVADVMHTSDQADRLFKVNPLLIVIDRRDDGLYILNQRRTVWPSFGIVGVPGGTITKGEPLLEGAKRKLREETGLHASFEYICLTRRILKKNDKIFADVFFPICCSETWSGTLRDTVFGENMWVDIDSAIKNDGDRDNRIEALPDVLTAIRSGNLNSIRGQFFEQTLRLG